VTVMEVGGCRAASSWARQELDHRDDSSRKWGCVYVDVRPQFRQMTHMNGAERWASVLTPCGLWYVRVVSVCEVDVCDSAMVLLVGVHRVESGCMS
jgi:hypothetical protein